MLVLTRRPSQGFLIGDDIRVVIVRVDGNKVRVGIQAPADVQVLREEVLDLDPAEPAEVTLPELVG